MVLVRKNRMYVENASRKSGQIARLTCSLQIYFNVISNKPENNAKNRSKNKKRQVSDTIIKPRKKENFIFYTRHQEIKEKESAIKITCIGRKLALNSAMNRPNVETEMKMEGKTQQKLIAL
jgi:hypothetical protein